MVPLAALLAPPIKPLLDSNSEMYLLAKLIYSFFVVFVVRFVLFLLVNILPTRTRICFFPKATYFLIQLDYTYGVESMQS